MKSIEDLYFGCERVLDALIAQRSEELFGPVKAACLAAFKAGDYRSLVRFHRDLSREFPGLSVQRSDEAERLRAGVVPLLAAGAITTRSEFSDAEAFVSYHHQNAELASVVSQLNSMLIAYELAKRS
jgi:hypothetical protein